MYSYLMAAFAQSLYDGDEMQLAIKQLISESMYVNYTYPQKQSADRDEIQRGDSLRSSIVFSTDIKFFQIVWWSVTSFLRI